MSAFSGNGYILFDDPVVSGRLKSQRLSDGKEFVLDGGSDGAIEVTDDGHAIFVAHRVSGISHYIVPIEGGNVQAVRPKNELHCYGTSLTHGLGITPWPDRLTGITTSNHSVGGRTALQIAGAQGGRAVAVTVAGNMIPASGPVDVTVNADLLQYPGQHVAASLHGSLTGIYGNLHGDTSGNYTFTRDNAGSQHATSVGSPFTLDTSEAEKYCILGLEMGRNDNINDTAFMLGIVADCVAYQCAYAKKYFLLSVLNGINEGNGTANHAGIVAYNAALAAAYPHNYIDVRSPPTTAEMAALDYTPSSDDLSDIANDCIPRGMRFGDGLHILASAQALWAMRIQAFLNAKGWAS